MNMLKLRKSRILLNKKVINFHYLLRDTFLLKLTAMKDVKLVIHLRVNFRKIPRSQINQRKKNLKDNSLIRIYQAQLVSQNL